MPTLTELANEVQSRSLPFVLRVGEHAPNQARILSPAPDLEEIGSIRELGGDGPNPMLIVALHGEDVFNSDERGFTSVDSVDTVLRYIMQDSEDEAASEVPPVDPMAELENLPLEDRVKRLERLSAEMSADLLLLAELKHAFLRFLGFNVG